MNFHYGAISMNKSLESRQNKTSPKNVEKFIPPSHDYDKDI